MTKITSEQVDKKVPNPTGKGGFQDHPELRNSGGRPHNANSLAYWYTIFKNMTVSELKNYEKNKSEDDMTVAESLVYARMMKSRSDLKEYQDMANRSEGMPKQTLRVEEKTDEMSDEEVDKRITEAINDEKPIKKSNKKI